MAFGEGKMCRKEGGGSCWGKKVISYSHLEFKLRLERKIRVDWVRPELSRFSDVNEKASLERHLIGIHRTGWQVGRAR